MEYTLEDTYEDLKELQETLRKEIEDLAREIENNTITNFNESYTSERMKLKQHKIADSTLKHISQGSLLDYPIPQTNDIYIDAIRDLQKEILNVEELLNKTRGQLQDIKKDITHLEKKKNGFNKMREMYLASVQTLEDKTYDNELIMTRRLFRDIKQDLHNVIELIFPNSENFKELLTTLTAAYDKGGDDVYVKVVSETLDYVKYLIEADIVTYHPNDKNKIRMVDLL